MEEVEDVVVEVEEEVERVGGSNKDGSEEYFLVLGAK